MFSFWSENLSPSLQRMHVTSCEWPVSWCEIDISFQLHYLAAQGHLLWDDCLLHVAFFLSAHHLIPFALYWRVTADKRLDHCPHVCSIAYLVVTINLATLCWIISFSRAVKALFPKGLYSPINNTLKGLHSGWSPLLYWPHFEGYYEICVCVLCVFVCVCMHAYTFAFMQLQNFMVKNCGAWNISYLCIREIILRKSCYFKKIYLDIV